MAQSVTLSKDSEINGGIVPKGTTLSVSTSIYERLKSDGAIKTSTTRSDATAKEEV